MATALSGSSPPPLPASVNVTKYFGGSSRKWSKETVLADHKDLQASAMGLSHHDNGQFALLGGRRYVSFIFKTSKKVKNNIFLNFLYEFYLILISICLFLGTCH